MSKNSLFNFDTVVIIGVGLIGGSLGLALKRLGIGHNIIGISQEQTLQEAQELGVIDDGFTYKNLDQGLEKADLVFLCTPISRILNLLPEVLKLVPLGCLVSDVGSTKLEIVSRATTLNRDGVYFIGGHPMTGSESRGVSAADPFLFEKTITVLTPALGVPEEVCQRMVDLVSRLGSQPIRLDPEIHDRIAAAVSHLPQMMATALVGMVGRLNETDLLPLKFAAGGFRDLTRIASSPYEMWKDICRTNVGPIREMISLYLEELTRLSEVVDDDRLLGHFENANQIRSSIPSNSKGFLYPLYEILLVVEDCPGVIARASGALADVGINIEDIEVLKIREGEGGTIRMGFGKQREAETAVEVLSRVGFSVRLR